MKTEKYSKRKPETLFWEAKSRRIEWTVHFGEKCRVVDIYGFEHFFHYKDLYRFFRKMLSKEGSLSEKFLSLELPTFQEEKVFGRLIVGESTREKVIRENIRPEDRLEKLPPQKRTFEYVELVNGNEVFITGYANSDDDLLSRIKKLRDNESVVKFRYKQISAVRENGEWKKGISW